MEAEENERNSQDIPLGWVVHAGAAVGGCDDEGKRPSDTEGGSREAMPDLV